MIQCPKCRAPLERDAFNTSELTSCSSCGAPTRVDVFPALFRDLGPGSPGEVLLVEDESSCFYHPKKKAAVSCAACGRFLCTLCDVEFDGRHLCTSCLETGKKKRKIKNLENHRTLYDSMVLFLAIFPMILFWPTILTAPIAIFLAIRYWNVPTSIIPRTKIRLIAAVVISGLQIIGWSAFIYPKVTS